MRARCRWTLNHPPHHVNESSILGVLRIPISIFHQLEPVKDYSMSGLDGEAEQAKRMEEAKQSELGAARRCERLTSYLLGWLGNSVSALFVSRKAVV